MKPENIIEKECKMNREELYESIRDKIFESILKGYRINISLTPKREVN